MELPERKERESGRDYALRTIKENIVHLTLAPGTMVSENELAAEMGLSRTPVREAIIELNKVKIIEIFPQRGSAISLVDFRLVEEAHFLRVTLECAMAERCCQRGLGEGARIALEENLQLQDFYLKTPTPTLRLMDLDNAFHGGLFKGAQLENAYRLMDSMTIHLDRVRTMHLYAAKELSSVAEHHAIYNALLNRDPAAAKQKIREHIGHYQMDDAEIRRKYKQFIKNEHDCAK